MWWGVDGSVAAGSIVSLVVSAMLVSRNIITIGDAFLLFQYVLLLGRPLEDMVDQLETVQKANGAMVRVIDLLAIEPDIRDEGTTLPPSGPLSVEFDDVTYDYGDDQIVLQSINLHFAAGRSVGIVGRTGSGKTTLSRLVLRLVESTSGTLRLGGVPIDDIPFSELRRRAALIPQEVELLSGTVATTSPCSTRHPPTMLSRPHCAVPDWVLSQMVEFTAHSVPAALGCRPARLNCSRSPAYGCATPTSSCSTKRLRASTL